MSTAFDGAGDLFEIEVPGTAVSRDRLLALRSLLEHERGDTPVRLLIQAPPLGVVVVDISKNYAVQPHPGLRSQIQSLFAPAAAA